VVRQTSVLARPQAEQGPDADHHERPQAHPVACHVLASSSFGWDSRQKSLPNVSPPLRVINALSVSCVIDLLMNRTDPSKNSALKPPSKWPPSLGSLPSGSNGRSSGFVHGTSFAASTARSVLLVPSTMSPIFRPRLPSKPADLPRK